ncbi:BTAD domain-containing putative transcriptional regulator [Kribbella sp. NPDC020789]
MERSGEHGLVVRVLGPTVFEAGTTILRIDRPLERALAVRLALARGAGVPDDALIRDLWPDDGAAKPIERLRVLIYRLRQTLGEYADAVRRTGSGYALNAVPVDLDAVEQLVGRSVQIDKALEQWRRPALEDLRGFPFGAAEGARLDALRLSLRTESIENKLAAGQNNLAEIEELVAENPLHERLVGLSAIALYRRGRQADALQRLADLRKRLAVELGIDPAPETTELELRLLRQDPALAGPKRVDRGTGRSVFVGRENELATLLELLGTSALITLTGGPGVGKTRLARELVNAAGRPAVWLGLAPITSREAVVAALAAAAGVDVGSGDPLPHIIEKLTDAVLVVDNAEHLIDAVAALLPPIRERAGGLTVLVTSQRPVRISGEEVRQIGPLDRDAAISLFRSRSGVGADDEIDLICAAVDRLPLAVELAAGLTRTLTVDQLAARIDHRLRLLVAGNRDTGVRHGSLRAAIDWSHSLLDAPAQAVLRRLAVFVGGCTLEAAEQVVAGEGIDPADVAPILVDLDDRSLLTVDAGDQGIRYRLLETVRDFALEQLTAAGEQIAVRRRHVDWCAELAVRTGAYGGSDHRELLDELRLEEANLRAALDWSLGPDGDPGRVLAIAAPTWWYWWSRGLMAPARQWLRGALDFGEADRTIERAAALRAIASLSRNSGDYEAALDLGNQALALYRELGNDPGSVSTVVGLSITNLALGNFEAGVALGRQAIDGAEQLGNPRILGSAVIAAGSSLRNLGRRDEAEEMFERSRRIWVEIDDRRGLAASLNNLAIVAYQRHDLARSRELAVQALEIYRELDLTEGLIDIVELLGEHAVDEDRPADAVRLLSVAATRRLRIGAPQIVPDELTARDRADQAARRALGPAAEALASAAEAEPIEPIADSLLTR